jgi:hypothetical protein
MITPMDEAAVGAISLLWLALIALGLLICGIKREGK